MLYAVYMIVAIIAGLGGPAIAVYLVKRLRRADDADIDQRTTIAIATALDPIVKQIAAIAENNSEDHDRLIRIESQFGPNGGGLRQAVNEVATNVGVVKATLGGVEDRLEDHLVQATDDRARLAAVERDMRARR